MMDVFVGIGSNVEPKKHIHAAVKLLRDRFGHLHLSPVYQNPALGFEGDDFFNLVAAFDTALDAEHLEALLKEIEMRSGRTRETRRFTPRAVDLDLLLFGDKVSAHPRLPRPDVLNYAFVLKPLADLAPSHRHPLTGQTYAHHWQEYAGEKDALRKIELPGL